jgi:hypothetical protein
MHLELPRDLVTMLTGIQAAKQGLDSKLSAVHDELRSKPSLPTEPREWYSVDEVAEMLGKRPYTVREWARHGQINAAKKAERRGGAALWTISAAEVARYRNEGLLGIDPERNSAS